LPEFSNAKIQIPNPEPRHALSTLTASIKWRENTRAAGFGERTQE
jgi:hypothetical protein